MNPALILLFFLPTPILEYEFVGEIRDTNGDMIAIKIEASSYAHFGVTYQSFYLEAVDRSMVFNPDDGEWYTVGDPINVSWDSRKPAGSCKTNCFSYSCCCGGPYDPDDIRFREDYIRLWRGDSMIFQMYAPTFQKSWRKD